MKEWIEDAVKLFWGPMLLCVLLVCWSITLRIGRKRRNQKSRAVNEAKPEGPPPPTSPAPDDHIVYGLGCHAVGGDQEDLSLPLDI